MKEEKGGGKEEGEADGGRGYEGGGREKEGG